MPPTIGFIGLGIMGQPMAFNLLRAGYPLVVHDRNPARLETLTGQGARQAATPPEVGHQSDIAITMLPDSPEVRQVALGEQGLLSGMRPGSLYIDMSSIAPATAVQLGEAGRARRIRVLDAPVSGGDVGAQKGSLSIMVGGDAAALDEARPVLEVLGRNIVHCGGNGAGQVVKVCNQILVGVTIAGVSEALTLGMKAGVDPQRIVQVLSAGLARCGVLENRGGRMIEHDFQPGFYSRLHLKDLRNAVAAGREFGLRLPATSLVCDLYDTLVRSGRGELDHTSLLALLEEQAGLPATAGGGG